jgi:hypothetical protein
MDSILLKIKRYKKQKYLIELKLRRGEKYLEKGLTQTANYMDIHGCSKAWVIVFDRRPKIKWKNKIYTKKEIVDGKTITIIGA